MVKPLYSKNGIRIYHGDSTKLLKSFTKSKEDLVLTDPPYGMSLPTNYGERKRTALTTSNDWDLIVGDDKPFNPAWLLTFPRLAMFGGNYYAHRLPENANWIVWDKLDGLKSKRLFGFNDQSDAELIWTTETTVIRILRHRWMGAMKGSEHRKRRVHPTQKPIKLMEMLLEVFNARKPIERYVIDPYMGAGSTLIAARNLGFKAIGIDLSRKYCDTAIERLENA